MGILPPRKVKMAPMHDIRPGLRERLDELAKKIADLRAAMDKVMSQKTAIETLLAVEETRFGTAPVVKTPTLALPDFLIEAVRERPRQKEALKSAAEGAGYEDAGRKVHVTLLNMVQSRRLRVREDGCYEEVADIKNPQMPLGGWVPAQ